MLISKFLTLLRRLGAMFSLLCITACASVQLNWQSLKTQIRNQFPTVAHISTTEFKEGYLGKSLLVDVRNDDEFAVSHIAGAVHFQDAGKLAAWIKQQPAQPVIVYCSVGYRSAQMVQSLQKLGIKPVFNLEGSIFEWANKGDPVVTQAGPTTKVHPFNEKWGQLLETQYHPKPGTD
ncbi:MAG: rhodanese-like domain-containing protein [Thermosynechococcaceae cyanobacterium]